MQIEQWNHYIGGKFVPPANGSFLEEYDPRSRQPSYRIARGTADDIEAAVNAAAEAWSAWRDRRPIERGRILLAIAQKIREHRDELSAIERNETGRPSWHAHLEMETAAQYFEFYGGLVNLPQGEVIDLGSAYHSYTRREPYGVVAVILPWNVPLNQAGRAIAPALAAGNVVVAKPSEFTSVTLLALAKLAVEECGLPPGVLNVVTGLGSEAGAALVGHSKVRKIAFTGSVRAGREIGKVAADRIVPVGLELGGKSPNIIFEDAALERAVAGTIKAFTFNSGQVCSAGSRCLVQRSIYSQFVERLKVGLATIKVGSGDDAGMGPIITGAQYEKIIDYQAVARSEGAEPFESGIMTEGSDSGWYVRPMILTHVRNDMRVAREEIFGPILPVIAFEDEAEAIETANDTDYGLVAGVWTNDLNRAHRVAAALEAGQIFINEYFAGGVETPFGGYKQSGSGREKGIEALHHYTQMKCVTIRI